MTAVERAERAEAADRVCIEAFQAAGCPEIGVALVAVGGYGRKELAPFSDLDLVLVYDDGVQPGDWAGQIWYPFWDSGLNIDHSVRTLSEVLHQAEADLRVALGMLDVRHLAGDPNLTLRLRSAVLNEWRRDARKRLPELREMVRSRVLLVGELAHTAVPDIKECGGGLRDTTVLNGLVATWLVDVPHAELERDRQLLLDVRDVLHAVAGRATDRVVPEYWAEIAAMLGLADAWAAQALTRQLGRRIGHISRMTWLRVDALLRAPDRRSIRRRPRTEVAAAGVAVLHDEVVLAAGARPQRDPTLLLRLAAVAAERELVLAPSTVARLLKEAPPMPDPWPEEARQWFVRLLASGRGLRESWESLDQAGAIEVLLPEWDRVRLLPSAATIHRFTVDRHSVETCMEASRLLRRVARVDVLMVAALLHDIGKGGREEHCALGAPIAREVAVRLGFDVESAQLIENLVRWHLLLPETATTRDPDDPETVNLITNKVSDREELDLLSVLTEADARATSDKAWSAWRAGMVASLVRRAGAALDERPIAASEPPAIRVPRGLVADPRRVAVEIDETKDGAVVRVMSGDRIGLLADAAAMLATQRLSVHAARVWTQDNGVAIGISEWSVADTDLDAAVLRTRLEAIAAGRIDASERLRRPAPANLDPIVVLHPEASTTATVVEVRADDRPGLLHTVCRALADADMSVRSAHVATLGPQAVDVFYVQEPGGGALTDDRAAKAATSIREALLATVAPT